MWCNSEYLGFYKSTLLLYTATFIMFQVTLLYSVDKMMFYVGSVYIEFTPHAVIIYQFNRDIFKMIPLSPH